MTALLTSLFQQQQQKSSSSSLTEWQEGLKALLPNVNIRFASDIDQVGASGNWVCLSFYHFFIY